MRNPVTANGAVALSTIGGAAFGTVQMTAARLKLACVVRDPTIDFPGALGAIRRRSAEPGLKDYPRLCDLMSRNGLAYLFLGIEP
jgi:hypothetical protein